MKSTKIAVAIAAVLAVSTVSISANALVYSNAPVSVAEAQRQLDDALHTQSLIAANPNNGVQTFQSQTLWSAQSFYRDNFAPGRDQTTITVEELKTKFIETSPGSWTVTGRTWSGTQNTNAAQANVTAAEKQLIAAKTAAGLIKPFTALTASTPAKVTAPQGDAANVKAQLKSQAQTAGIAAGKAAAPQAVPPKYTAPVPQAPAAVAPVATATPKAPVINTPTPIQTAGATIAPPAIPTVKPAQQPTAQTVAPVAVSIPKAAPVNTPTAQQPAANVAPVAAPTATTPAAPKADTFTQDLNAHDSAMKAQQTTDIINRVTADTLAPINENNDRAASYAKWKADNAKSAKQAAPVVAPTNRVTPQQPTPKSTTPAAQTIAPAVAPATPFVAPPKYTAPVPTPAAAAAPGAPIVPAVPTAKVAFTALTPSTPATPAAAAQANQAAIDTFNADLADHEAEMQRRADIKDRQRIDNDTPFYAQDNDRDQSYRQHRDQIAADAAAVAQADQAITDSNATNAQNAQWNAGNIANDTANARQQQQDERDQSYAQHKADIEADKINAAIDTQNANSLKRSNQVMTQQTKTFNAQNKATIAQGDIDAHNYNVQAQKDSDAYNQQQKDATKAQAAKDDAQQKQITGATVIARRSAADVQAASKDMQQAKAEAHAANVTAQSFNGRMSDAETHIQYNDQQINQVAKQSSSNSRQLANHSQRLDKLDNNFKNLRDQVGENKKEANAGIAGAIAIGSLPQVMNDQTFGVTAAGGTYNGESAVAVGFSARASQSTVIKAGVTTDTAGNVGAGAGVLIGW